MQHVAQPRTLPRHGWTARRSNSNIKHTVSLLTAEDLRPPIVSAAPASPSKVQTISIEKCEEVDEHPSDGCHPHQRASLDQDLLGVFSDTYRKMMWQAKGHEAHRPIRQEVAEKEVHVENGALLGPLC